MHALSLNEYFILSIYVTLMCVLRKLGYVDFNSFVIFGFRSMHKSLLSVYFVLPKRLTHKY